MRTILVRLEAARSGSSVSMHPIPERGDLIWVDFGWPPVGHEQAHRRPALVLSPSSYNRFGLALACPITSRVKGYPFEVALPNGLNVSGVILADQLESIDWRVRHAGLIGRLPSATIAEVLAKSAALLS
jgi:mRNA interferase MazF